MPRIFLVAVAACLLGVGPVVAEDAVGTQPQPRSLPETAGLDDAALRAMISKLCKRVEELRDETASLRFREKSRAADAAADALIASRVSADSGPARATPVNDPADDGSEQAGAKGAPNKADPGAGAIPGATAAPAAARSWNVTVTNTVILDETGIMNDMSMEQNRSFELEQRLSMAQAALKESLGTVVWRGDTDRRGNRIWVPRYTEAEIARRRSYVSQTDAELRASRRRLQQLREQLDAARNSTTITGVTDDGDSITATARRQFSSVARMLRSGDTVHIEGVMTRAKPSLEVLVTGLVPMPAKP